MDVRGSQGGCILKKIHDAKAQFSAPISSCANNTQMRTIEALRSNFTVNGNFIEEEEEKRASVDACDTFEDHLFDDSFDSEQSFKN